MYFLWFLRKCFYHAGGDSDHEAYSICNRENHPGFWPGWRGFFGGEDIILIV